MRNYCGGDRLGNYLVALCEKSPLPATVRRRSWTKCPGTDVLEAQQCLGSFSKSVVTTIYNVADAHSIERVAIA